jgi:dihydroxyacetone kinase
MLTAAVLGGVFASPSAASVYEAVRAVAGPRGCLLIVKNYTGPSHPLDGPVQAIPLLPLLQRL